MFLALVGPVWLRCLRSYCWPNLRVIWLFVFVFAVCLLEYFYGKLSKVKETNAVEVVHSLW
jgi:hypothetical protein